MKKYHTTKDGKKMLISDMETSHLNAMIKFIERKAEDGLMLVSGSPGDGDVEYLYGIDVMTYFRYMDYVQESRSRGIPHDFPSNEEINRMGHFSFEEFYHDVLNHN